MSLSLRMAYTMVSGKLRDAVAMQVKAGEKSGALRTYHVFLCEKVNLYISMMKGRNVVERVGRDMQRERKQDKVREHTDKLSSTSK